MHALRPFLRVVLAIALVAAVAACGADDDDDAAPTTSASSTSSSTTSSSTGSSSPSPGCGADPIEPEDPASTAEADVDGDGRDDELTTFIDSGTNNWRLHVAFGSGGSTGVDAAPVAAGSVDVLGGVDLDGDDGEEIWATVGSGASASIIGLFRLDECELSAVELAGGPAEFAVGGSVRNVSGLECRARAGGSFDILAYDGASDDGENYSIEVIEYRLDDGELVLGGRSERSTTASGPDFTRYTTFTCDDVSL